VGQVALLALATRVTPGTGEEPCGTSMLIL